MPRNVTISFQHLINTAQHLGSQDVSACPPLSDVCWGQRKLAAFTKGKPADIECTECWLRWFTTGT